MSEYINFGTIQFREKVFNPLKKDYLRGRSMSCLGPWTASNGKPTSEFLADAVCLFIGELTYRNSATWATEQDQCLLLLSVLLNHDPFSCYQTSVANILNVYMTHLHSAEIFRIVYKLSLLWLPECLLGLESRQLRKRNSMLILYCKRMFIKTLIWHEPRTMD